MKVHFIVGFIFLITIVCFALVVKGQVLVPSKPNVVGMNDVQLQKIDKIVQQYIDSQWIGGATCIVTRHGKIVYHKAFGYKDAAKKSPEMVDDIFRIASQTKAITSVAVMMLLEDGKFLLDDPISKYLPEFAKPTILDKFNEKDSSYSTIPSKKEITIRQLLTHTSGIGYAQIGSKEANAIYAKADITAGIGVAKGRILSKDMKRCAKLPLMHTPGEKFTYGLNTDVLGYLVEVISGQPLDVFFRTRIFNPLGMKDTWFYLPKEKQGKLVALHVEDSLGHIYQAPKEIQRNGSWISDYPNLEGTYFSGGAGLSSTTLDYAIFLEMIRNGGKYNGKRLLSQKSIAIMTQNQIGNLSLGGNSKFGLGFQISGEGSNAIMGLNPGTISWGGAFSSTYWVDLKAGIVGQFFLNQTPNSHSDLHDKFKLLVNTAIED